MHISLTRVFLECMLAYHLNGYAQAKKVLIHYTDKVSIKNKKTLRMILEQLELSDNDTQKQYFKLLSDSL